MTSLKESDEGDVLDRDQREAITKIKDVTVQLELVKELQKQFTAIETEVSSVWNLFLTRLSIPDGLYSCSMQSFGNGNREWRSSRQRRRSMMLSNEQ